MIGTARKTRNDRLITWAMRRPSYWSRTMATASTRVEAAPTPCSARAMRRVSKLQAKAATALKAT